MDQKNIQVLEIKTQESIQTNFSNKYNPKKTKTKTLTDALGAGVTGLGVGALVGGMEGAKVGEAVCWSEERGRDGTAGEES